MKNTLLYNTRWLGNSFGGGPSWVQNFCEGMFVSPDGTVFVASGWDEGGREYGFYKDGAIVGKCEHTHGWGVGGGDAVAATERYVFISNVQGNEGGGLKGPEYPEKGKNWFGVSRYDRAGKPAAFPGGKGRFGAMLVLHERPEKDDAHLHGLAVSPDGTTLYVSDNAGNQLRSYETSTMRLLTSHPCPTPGPLAVDRAGVLWVRSGNVLFTVDSSGKLPKRLSLPSPIKPQGFAFDRRNRLLLADSGPDQNIKVYQRDKLIGAIGERGGMWAGAQRGKTGPLRFANPMGVGVDAKDNLYVGCNTPGGGTVLRSFSSTQKLQWELLGLEFVDTADADPQSDGTDVFTTEGRYTLTDLPKFAWTWRAQTVDPFRYPSDLRLHDGNHLQCAPQVRILDSKRFLIVRGMWQGLLCFYRIEGETAVPCVVLSQDHYRADDGWEPPGQPKTGGWLWRDTNGDGQMQASEYSTRVGPDGEFWASNVDAAGDIWQASQDGTIWRWRFGGLDKNGVPRYDAKTVEKTTMPTPMTQLLRTEYLLETDTMLLAGHTTDRPKTGGEWGAVGSELLRFEGWSTGKPKLAWRTALPYDPETHTKTPGASVSNTIIVSLCTAGEYAFAVESRTAIVHVYRLSDGSKVGTLAPGPEVFKESGWVDFRDAIRAVQRKNNTYRIFVEEDWKGKVLVYDWTPESK